MKLKFTIQHMLWATFAFGFVALGMSAAYRGNLIAKGLLLAPVVMIVTFVVLAAVYWPCYIVSRMLYPPIHTPAVDFFKNQSSPEKAPTVGPATSGQMPPANTNLPAAEDASTGAPE